MERAENNLLEIMTDPYREHPDEEALERFLMNHSTGEELEFVETHIFACESCVEQLETLQVHIAAAKLALASAEAKRIQKESARQPGFWKQWFTIPHLSYASAFAVLALGAIVFSTPRDVTITAYRGTETAIVSQWHPLHVHLNAAGLNAGPASVELVDANNSTIWRGTAAVENDKLDVKLPRLMNSGNYYLRLFSVAKNGSDPDLLREFVLQAKPEF